MTTLALHCIKGGVGKTTTAVNLAYLASLSRGPCLLCDLDPQGGASYYLRIRADKGYGAKKLLRGGKHTEAEIKATHFAHFDLLPSAFSYRKLDVRLDRGKRPRRRLAEILEPLGRNYRTLIIDSPPGIGLASEAILRAADLVLCPLIPSPLSMQSHETLVGFMGRRKSGMPPVLAFFCLTDRRRSLHRQTVEDNAGTPGFLRSVIPYSSEVERSGLERVPICAHHPTSPPAMAYEALWRECLEVLDAES